MWEWQVYFGVSCKVSAETVFNKFDRGLYPEVFLLGLLKNNRPNRSPVCIEPEVVKYPINEFKDIKNIAKTFYEGDDDRNIFYSDADNQKEVKNALVKKSYQMAIEEIINKSPHNVGTICFVSTPVEIADFDVFIVLELNRIIYESHVHLKLQFVRERIPISKSILESLVQVFLESLSQQLYLPNPGKSLSLNSRGADELLREAAKKFQYTISSKGEDFSGLHGFADACDKISRLKYEGDENLGHLIIAKQHHPDVECIMELEEPFPISHYRKTLKILRLTASDIGVLSNSNMVFGLGRVKDSYLASTESIFNIRFEGIGCWTVYHNGASVLEMKHGLPGITLEAINKDKFHTTMRRLFSTVTTSQIENLFNLSSAITREKKGGLLIISADAREEAKRLKEQCLFIKPMRLTPETLLDFTIIDGGLLIDLDGIAHAHGVILDGLVGLRGDSARGSRFNSAVTYTEYRGLDKPTIVIVVSTDGMVDVIPNLMPQIRHSEIKQVIGTLEKLKNELPDRSVFNNVMFWLANREFYLTNEECKTINVLKEKIEKKDNDWSSVRIVHRDFKPDSEMNSSYYLSE
jgi:hypothetical protein